MYKSHLPVSFPFFKSAIDAPLSFSQGLGDESPNGSNKKKVEKKKLGRILPKSTQTRCAKVLRWGL